MSTGDMTGLEAGANLAAVPIDMLLSALGVGIAKAQAALDNNSLATATKLLEVTLDDPRTGETRSLLTLGFTPAFYHFTEATLELRIEMKMQVEDTSAENISGSVEGNVGPVAVGGSVSVEKARKYGAESSAMTHVNAKIVSIPAPQEFLNFINKLDNPAQTNVDAEALTEAVEAEATV
jgi:hypothetical protein